MVQSCFLCNQTMELFMNKNGYRIYRCPVCLLGMTEFANHYEEFVRKFYQKGYFTGDPKYGAFTQYEQDKQNIKKNLLTIVRQMKKFQHGGKLLDAGCAMGYMVEAAIENGFDAYGFDPSSYALSRAEKSLQPRLKESTIKSATYKKESFDVMTLTDVFEHLNDPVQSLQKLRTLLKPHGYIVIATGNTQSIAARVFGWRWTFYIPPQHLYFYNKANLTLTLERTGFTPVHWFSIGKWLSLGYILHLAEVSSHIPGAGLFGGFAKRTKLDDLSLYVPMMDNMVVIAQKTPKVT